MKKAVLFFVLCSAHFSWSQTKTAIDSINNISFALKTEKAAYYTAVYLKNANVAQKINYQSGVADSYSNLSLIYYYQGKYDENVAYSLKAIKIYEQTKQREKLAAEYGELGYRMKRRNMPKAQEYMQIAKRISEKQNFTLASMKIYDNYGVLKEMQNQLDSALFFYNKALALKEVSHDSVGIPYSLNNIAGIYLMQKRFDTAKSLYEKVLKIRQSTKDHIGIAENYTSFGDLYATQNNHKAAIEYYKKALEMATHYNYIDLMSSSYKMLSQEYELLGNNNEAFRNYKMHIQYKDSILNQHTNAKIAELEVEFQTNEKEKQLAENRNQLLQKDIQVRKSRFSLIIIAVFAFFLMLISYLVYRQQKLKNKQQAQEFDLKTAISQIETQNKLQEQRLTISRDLHDNIGAQLTFIISSVDNLKFGFNIENKQLDNKLKTISDFAQSTIVELRDTIWAMNNNAITFNDLKTRVLNFIEKAKIAKEEISFKFEIDTDFQNLKMTSIVGMNIYRTIQEAVNNCIKYSHATAISIETKHVGNTIEISISDNGLGFDIQDTETGNGLQNMKKRIESIRGKFSVTSEITKGTKIKIVLPEPKSSNTSDL